MTQEQWEEVAENAYPRVYRALVALGASPEDAADALQDAFERGLRRGRSDTRAIDRPDAWLFVVALRRWRTHRWRRRLFLPLDALRDRSTTPAPGENAVVLISELKRLPRREREVITCRYILGLTQRETALTLGIAVGTVAAATVHATRKLRGRIDGTVARPGSEAPTIR
jgi:RNA polymerase sigma factor (sigma-70 family)